MLPSIILGVALFFTVTVVLSVANILISHNASMHDKTEVVACLIRAALFAAVWAFYHYLTH